MANSKYNNIENLFYLPEIDIRLANMKKLEQTSVLTLNHGGSWNPEINLNNRLAPVDKPRFIQDSVLWRNAIREAEHAVLPQRYLMQLQYMDTILDAHIRACWEMRERLTLGRKYKLCDDNGNINEEWTSYFKKPWFKTFSKYCLGARAYGYSLVSMGEIINGEFNAKQIVLIPRTHISPDRLCVQLVPTSTTGPMFLEEPYIGSHIWISTPDEHGLAACGYGILYELTLLAIANRNNFEYNQDFLEVFGMPFRYINTDRTDDANLSRLESIMQQMSSLGYAILGNEEKVTFDNSGQKGNGYKGYGDLELRIEKKVSKILLGHSDAMDSTPGKLEALQGSETSPQAQALNTIQSEDGDFMMEQINEKLLPFMKMNGINIPLNLHFEYCNDTEDKEIEKFTNDQNVNITKSITTLAQGGYIVDAKYIEEITGFKLTDDKNLLVQKGQFWIEDKATKNLSDEGND